MKLKRFTGKTEFEAMEQVRKELGEEAIIMNTKKVRPKGFFGFLKKHEYELLVGLEDKKPEPTVKQEEFQALLKDNLETKRELKDIKDYMQKMNEYMEERRKREEDEASARREAQAAKKAEEAEKAALATEHEPVAPPREERRNLTLETERKRTLRASEALNLARELFEEDEFLNDPAPLPVEAKINLAKDENNAKPSPSPVDNIREASPEHGRLARLREMELYKKLTSKGVNEELSFDICDLIMRQLPEGEADEEKIRRLSKIALKNMLGAPYQIPNDKNRQSIFFFVGPTGVGKTTTIAKIATKLSFIDGRDLALVTADTFRIAAVEQLKVYGDILNLPVSVVYKPIELKDILNKYKNKEIILVDTAGKSHLDEGMQSYISSYLDCAPQAEKFLLISLTKSYRDIESIVKAYRFLGDYKLIFTKMDEASSPGNILNIKHKTGRNTSFITNGQSVPDDIIVADPEEIVNILLGD